MSVLVVLGPLTMYMYIDTFVCKFLTGLNSLFTLNVTKTRFMKVIITIIMNNNNDKK